MIDKMSGKITPEVINLLEQRNKEGQTAFFAATVHNSPILVEYMIDHFPGLDL